MNQVSVYRIAEVGYDHLYEIVWEIALEEFRALPVMTEEYPAKQVKRNRTAVHRQTDR